MPKTSTSDSATDRASGQASGKERILNAAMLLFARMPYSDTSLRDIASAAGVDVAYVHRAFGSKAEIFRQALQVLGPLEEILAVQDDGQAMIHKLCDLAFLHHPRKLEDVRPPHLLIQSTLCGEARQIISEFIETALAIPLSRSFGHTNTGRAHFALSLLSGFMTHRAVMAPPDLMAIPEAEQHRMLQTALNNIMRESGD